MKIYIKKWIQLFNLHLVFFKYSPTIFLNYDFIIHLFMHWIAMRKLKYQNPS